MLNVQALRDTLSAMDLPRLQAYLRQHQDDPYTVTMGLSIAKDKQKAILAQQGMAGQQQMPKVVDQEIAQIAPRAMPMPEDVGIGQLSADNLKGLCGGGIVAFDEGGAVPRYQTGGVMAGTEYAIPGMTQSTLLQDAIAKLNEGRELSGQEKAILFASKPLTAAADVAVSPVNLIRRLVRNPLDDSPLPSMTPVSDARARALGLDQSAPAPAPTRAAPSADDLGPVPGSKDTDVMGGMPTAAPRQASPTAGPTGPAGPRPPAGPAAVATPTAGIPGLLTTAEDIQKALADAQKGITPEVDPRLRGSIEDIQKAEQAAKDRYVQSLRDEQAARQPAMQDFEARLKQREERLGRQERDLGPLALLQAGMAIMGGSSPFAAVNVGAGAQIGIERYTKGAEKLEAARDKLDEAFGKIEEVRRNEKRLDAKELREALRDAEQPAIEAKKTLFNALHEDFKLKRADATKGVELLMKTQMDLYKEAEQTKRTNIMAGANDPLALFKALGRGDKEVATGLELATKLKSEPKTEADIKEQWAKSAVLQTRYPDINDFVRMMKGTTALQMGQQLNPADAALVNKYLQPPR